MLGVSAAIQPCSGNIAHFLRNSRRHTLWAMKMVARTGRGGGGRETARVTTALFRRWKIRMRKLEGPIHKFTLRLSRAIPVSKFKPQMFLSDDPINLARWNSSLDAAPGVEEEREGMPGAPGSEAGGEDHGSGVTRDTGCAQGLDVPALVDFVRSNHVPHSVIIDCSAANTVTRDHASWLSKGVHVVRKACLQ